MTQTAGSQVVEALLEESENMGACSYGDSPNWGDTSHSESAGSPEWGDNWSDSSHTDSSE